MTYDELLMLFKCVLMSCGCVDCFFFEEGVPKGEPNEKSSLAFRARGSLNNKKMKQL